MSEIISAFSAVSNGSHLFAFFMLFLCCNFVVICSGKSMYVVYNLFVNIVLAVCMLVGGDVSEKGSSVMFSELCTVIFLHICDSLPVVLKFIFLFCIAVVI